LRLGLIIASEMILMAALTKVHDLGNSHSADLTLRIPGTVGKLRAALDKTQNRSHLACSWRGRAGKSGILTMARYQSVCTARDPRSARGAHPEKLRLWPRSAASRPVQTHLRGFFRKIQNEPAYKETVAVLRELAGVCKANGQNSATKPGRRRPITLVRAIQDVGLGQIRA